MSEQAMLTPRRRGRPRVEEPRATLSTWIPAQQHDRIIRTANRLDQSVSEVVRTIINRWDREAAEAATSRNIQQRPPRVTE